MEYDLDYFADIFSKLCGIPARIYENGIRKSFYSIIKFPKDPFTLLEKDLIKHNNSIGYITTDDFFYYGYINKEDKAFVLGPARIVKADDKVISDLAFELNIDKEDIQDFRSAMKSLIPLPLESLMQALCSLNYVLNNEKKSMSDILIGSAIKEDMDTGELKSEYSENEVVVEEHNTIDIENNILRIVEHGEIDELNEWLKNMPSVRGGILSSDALRQIKNTFIATVTLVSRAAIKGGLDINESLSLSDLYIQKMELMNSLKDTSELQVKLLLDYTRRVAKIRGKGSGSAFLISINKYIYAHLSDAIKSEDICKAIYVSKSVLFERIKKETGKTVSEYILNIKVNESKSLLKYSDKSISQISTYLGFSSQSHYNRVFKENTGITPNKYREKHK